MMQQILHLLVVSDLLNASGITELYGNSALNNGITGGTFKITSTIIGTAPTAANAYIEASTAFNVGGIKLKAEVNV